jgi:hypothetical protein
MVPSVFLSNYNHFLAAGAFLAAGLEANWALCAAMTALASASCVAIFPCLKDMVIHILWKNPGLALAF